MKSKLNKILKEIQKVGQKAIQEKITWKDCLIQILGLYSKSQSSRSGTDVFFEELRSMGYFEEFSEEEQICFIVMVCEFVENGLTPIDFSNYDENKGSKKMLKGKDKLLAKGIIIRINFDEDDDECYLFAPKICKRLFKGAEDMISLSVIAKFVDIVKADDIVKKELFFNNNNIDEINEIRHMLQSSKFENIMKIIEKRKQHPAFICLLYGLPGTGKTELVKQIALETNRDILAVNPAYLITHYIGDASRFKTMFLMYKYVCCIANKTPILLINEADAILTKRITSIENSADVDENRIQNVILQELENFEGILFATTNMAGNLDKAFERRLFFKLHLEKPDEIVRKQIWLSLLSAMSDEDASYLASEYEFTGAEIDNIVQKIEIYEALHGHFPSINTIVRFCKHNKFNTNYLFQNEE